METSGYRILLVEDDQDTQVFLSYVLAQAGYRLTVACTCADGRQLAQPGQFDLYILDNWLPDGTGISLCREIRQLDATTPIMFFSGVVQQSEQKDALAAGAQFYLTKPLEAEDLMKFIRSLLPLTRNAAKGE